MKVVQLYNRQRAAFGGEETVIANTTAVLEARGHAVSIAMRCSRGIEGSFLKKASAGLNGIYSFSAIGEVKKIIATEHPDVIHVHGVYPQWSPSIFRTCKQMGVPTVLHVHCHYLTCPDWYHLREGKVCELCFGGHEQNGILKNCRGSYAESTAYALRSFVSRKMGFFTDHVGVFLPVSRFLKDRLIRAGFPDERTEVLHNVVLERNAAKDDASELGTYIGYCGRLSPEKGVGSLLQAARLSGLPVRIAGDGPERAALERMAPPNVTFLGYLNRDGVNQFYQGMPVYSGPQLSFESFSMSAAEAMMQGKPIIGARIGAIPEIIDNGKTGLLFEPGNAQELAEQMSNLWASPEQCLKYGNEARSTIRMKCSEDLYYSRLMAAYQHAGAFAGRSARAVSPPFVEPAASTEPCTTDL